MHCFQHIRLRLKLLLGLRRSRQVVRLCQGLRVCALQISYESWRQHTIEEGIPQAHSRINDGHSQSCTQSPCSPCSHH